MGRAEPASWRSCAALNGLALGFRDRLFARIREEGVLVLWCESLEEKEFFIEGDPEKFFTAPHYDGHPNVLVRLAAIDREELAELLAESFRIRGGTPG